MAKVLTAVALMFPALSYGSILRVDANPADRTAQPQNGRHKPRSAEENARRRSYRAQNKGCLTPSCDRRVTRKFWRRYTAPYRAWLRTTGNCETNGLPNQGYNANTGNGFYGRYQFTASTWWSVGGHGYAHNAPPLEQDFRAIKVLKRDGRGAWPVCG